jgi:ribosomal protein S18 acetylase RimI-like enzyme
LASEPPRRLVPRLISEDDRVWLGLFSAGERRFWEKEVTDYVRDQAWPFWLEGWSTTHLFSLEESPEIVGYVSACVHHWNIKRTEGVFPKWDREIRQLPDRVPVLRIPYLAVAEKHQGRGYGTEMFLQFQEMLAVAPGAPRFVYLECWEDNAEAVRFYNEIGFEQYDIEAFDKVPYDEMPGNLIRLAYDRFRLPT